VAWELAIRKVDLRRVNVNVNNITLAVDVYNDLGVLISPSGVRINEELKDHLLEHGRSVVTVNMKAAPGEVIEEEAEAEFASIGVEKEEEYEEYKKDYAEMEEQLNGTLNAVCKGEVADFEKTFEATDGLLSKLIVKSDVFLYMNFMRNYDDYTAVHSNHVGILANIFGHWLGLSKDEIATLTIAGAMHDVGKIELPIEIMNKPGKLTAEERRIVNAHATKGYLLLKKYDLPKGVVMGAYSHHEKMDGTGYPLGLTGNKVDHMAKIISIIDKYDALTSDRPHRARLCPFEVIRLLEIGMFNELDTELLLIFLRHIAANYLGAWVSLTDGTEAKIIFIHPTNVSKPLVQTADDRFIDLAERPDLRIVALI
jgi:HD-GYP domain-containing protein (c-di-GMP phosphodiesterase class II)